MALLDGRYDIDAEIGRGISGSVFQARDNQSGRLVLIKRLDPDGQRAQHAPYLSEWDKIAALDHPAIARVIEHSEEGSERYIVGEFINGESLHQHLSITGHLTENECASVFRAISEGLAVAHNQGVLHLNLKPQNIMLTHENGRLSGKLTDFGLWTMGLDEGPQGNALAFYKAPEQRRGSGVNETSDVYALGKVLYVALSGETSGRITPDALPSNSPLQDIIYRCIRTNSEDRYQSMAELNQALAEVEGQVQQSSMAGDLPQMSGPTSSTPGPIKSPTLQPLGAGIAGAATNQFTQPGDIGSTGQLRATTEVQSMLLACRSHLNNRRLTTCRGLLAETHKMVEEYAGLQGIDWAQSNTIALDEIEQELVQSEKELAQLAQSAKAAFDDGRFEDVQTSAIAAREVTSEHIGFERLEEEAEQNLGNIRTFLEEAQRCMAVKNYKKADIACIKILDLNPKHREALAFRDQIKRVLRSRKRIRFCLKVLPIILVIAGVGGWLFFIHTQHMERIKKFDSYLAKGYGDEAAEQAQLLKNTNEYLFKFKILAQHGPALKFLKDKAAAKDAMDQMNDAKKLITEELLEHAEVKSLWDSAGDHAKDAADAFKAGKFSSAIDSAGEAETDYHLGYVVYQKAIAKEAIAKEDWKTANKIAEECLKLVDDDDELTKMLNQSRANLVPELILSTEVKGSEAPGARVFINGELKGVTPVRIRLEIGKEHKLLVVMPPKKKAYFKPQQQTIIFKDNMAKTLCLDLEMIAGPIPGETWERDDLKLKMKPIKAGEFQMGSETGRQAEKPPHKIELTYNFWMSETEISRAQFKKVMGKEVDEDDDRFPMVNVSWSEASEFARRLTIDELGRNRVPVGYVYRLPTEAEWEYACRAGKPESEPVDINEFAWHSENSDKELREIASKAPNPWGIYDLRGNVAEWCLDWHNRSTYLRRTSHKDVIGPTHGRERSVRGGNYLGPPTNCTPHYRGSASQKLRSKTIGLRLVLAPAEQQLRKKK